MPSNQLQRMVFAFITVVITVHAFVFYNIYVLNGDMLRSFNYTSSVLTAVKVCLRLYARGACRKSAVV